MRKAKTRLNARREQPEYRFRGNQALIQTLTDDEIVLSGPAGTGKSLAWLYKVNAAAWQYPGMRALIVRKTRVSLTESGLVTFEKYVLGEGNPICAGAARANRSLYTYPNGSEIVVGGLDRPTRVMSSEYDIIYVQEGIELMLDDYEALTTRLRNGVLPYQQLIMDVNPDRADHWIVKRAQSGTLRMLETRHEDNPALFDDDGELTPRGRAYIAKLDNLTGVRKQRLRYGKWVNAEGAVYEDWNPAIHLIDPFEIPATWRRIGSIDFGYTNPFVCQLWAIDPDGRMYMYREIYMTKRTVAEHAVTIKKMIEGERIERWVADHDAEDRATLEKLGINTEAAKKAVTVGIQAVQERIKKAGDGKPRFFILRDSLYERDEDLAEANKPICTADEIGGYQWVKGKDGKPVKEEPVKVDDHGVDTARYAVMAIDEASVGMVKSKAPGLYPSSQRQQKPNRGPRT